MFLDKVLDSISDFRIFIQKVKLMRGSDLIAPQIKLSALVGLSVCVQQLNAMIHHVFRLNAFILNSYQDLQCFGQWFSEIFIFSGDPHCGEATVEKLGFSIFQLTTNNPI